MLILFSILPFVSTNLGGYVALRLQHRLHPIMAFAAGVLMATALADLLPEAAEQLDQLGGASVAGGAAVVGFLVFSALDAFLHRQAWEHQHSPLQNPHTPHEHSTDLGGLVGPLGLIVHSTLDGVAIGLGFRTNAQLGLIIALAVLVHDFADGMNVVTLTLAGGRERRSAITLLVLDAVAPVLGAVLGTVVPLPGAMVGVLISVFAGVFVAIGAGHLLPEAQHRSPGAAPQLVLLAALGSAVVIGVRRAMA